MIFIFLPHIRPMSAPRFVRNVQHGEMVAIVATILGIVSIQGAQNHSTKMVLHCEVDLKIKRGIFCEHLTIHLVSCGLGILGSEPLGICLPKGGHCVIACLLLGTRFAHEFAYLWMFFLQFLANTCLLVCDNDGLTLFIFTLL